MRGRCLPQTGVQPIRERFNDECRHGDGMVAKCLPSESLDLIRVNPSPAMQHRVCNKTPSTSLHPRPDAIEFHHLPSVQREIRDDGGARS